CARGNIAATDIDYW
nr:immunoglobulin heavy chain junction region [Macaca mulatta]